MAMYEYACTECGNSFEKIIRNAADMRKVTCPSCGTKKVKRQISRFAAVGNSSGGGDFASSGDNCSSGFG